MTDEPELPDEEEFEADPMERIEALEARCNVLESVLSFIAHALAPDWEARMRMVHTLNQFEAEARKRNVHDDGIDTARRIRLLIAGEDED